MLFRLAKKIGRKSDENMLASLFFERRLFYVDRIVLFERNQRVTRISVGKKLDGLDGAFDSQVFIGC